MPKQAKAAPAPTMLYTSTIAPRLAIAGVRTFRGMEGYGLNAKVLFDGKPVALAIDDGNGGMMWFEWAGMGMQQGTARATQQAVEAYVASLPPELMTAEDKAQGLECLYTNGTRQRTLEDLVNNMANAYMEEKALARKRKTHILFRKPGQGVGEMMQLAHKGNPTAALAYVLRKYPTATIL